MCTATVLWSTGHKEKRVFPDYNAAWDWVHETDAYSRRYGCYVKNVDYSESED